MRTNERKRREKGENNEECIKYLELCNKKREKRENKGNIFNWIINREAEKKRESQERITK